MSIEYNGKLLLAGCLILNEKNEALLLRRRDHGHYETPGGKVEESDSNNFDQVVLGDLNNPPFLELLVNTALREAGEEIGKKALLEKPAYCVHTDFEIPGGRLATAYTFATRVLHGTPTIQEMDKFSGFDYFALAKMTRYSKISPNLKMVAKKLEEFAKRLS